MLLGSEHEPAHVHSSLELNLDDPSHHQPLGKPNEGIYPLVRGAFLSSCLDWGMSGGGVGESGGDCLELSSLHEAAPLLGMLSQLNLFRTRAYATSSRKTSQIASSSFLSFRLYVLLALNGIFCLLDLTLPFEFHLPFQPQACYYLPLSFPCFLQKSLSISGI